MFDLCKCPLASFVFVLNWGGGVQGGLQKPWTIANQKSQGNVSKILACQGVLSTCLSGVSAPLKGNLETCWVGSGGIMRAWLSVLKSFECFRST